LPGPPWYWQIISLLVGMGALYCTVNLYSDSEEKTEGSSWRLYPWVVGISWQLGVWILASILPQYWSELFPLLVIGALYGASRLWTARETEDSPQELSSSVDAN
jgi:hypothetical protein